MTYEIIDIKKRWFTFGIDEYRVTLLRSDGKTININAWGGVRNPRASSLIWSIKEKLGLNRDSDSVYSAIGNKLP